VIARLNAFVAVWEGAAESLTCMVTENVPASVGAPAILPVDAVSVSPGGNEPPATLQLLGSVFPLSPSREV
jgi:hypothetical protein